MQTNINKSCNDLVMCFCRVLRISGCCWQRILTVFVAMMFCTSALGGERVEQTQHWNSAETFDSCYRDRAIDALAEPGSLRLVDSVLVADDLGAGANNFQPIRGKTQARKIVVIDDTRVSEALLMVDGSVRSCEVVVNGVVLDASPLPTTFINRNFEHYEIPPALLRSGTNTFVFRSRSEGRSLGRIRVERGRAYRSSVSRDGGYTWVSDRFGDPGTLEGELGVRLRLGRFAPSGQITSPVLDLAAAVMKEGIASGRNGRVEALDLEAELPPETSVRRFIRMGKTPDGHEETWGAWQPWPLAEPATRFERFVQWRLELKTQDPEQTPIVRQVSIRWSAEPPDAPSGTIRLVEDANQIIVRSSYPFAYASPSGSARFLRDHWDLEAVVEGAATEFEMFKTLRQWVRDQWTSGWSMGRLNYVPAWDARVILSLAPDNLSLGMCTHYAAVFVQAAQALGIPARPVFHGHALSELWSNTHGKWVLMDAGGDTNDRRRGTYHYKLRQDPMNLLDLHKASYDDEQWSVIEVIETNQSDGHEPNLWDDQKSMDLLRSEENAHNVTHIFYELRNTFMDHPEPAEPEHGMGHFKYRGHLFWKTAQTPDVTWTDFFTTRAADLDWTLNQAQIHLSREPGASPALRVMLDTVTPNFASYEVRLNGESWIALQGRRPLGSVNVSSYPVRHDGQCVEFVWSLKPGRNQIEARPINTSGVPGIISRMVVDVAP